MCVLGALESFLKLLKSLRHWNLIAKKSFVYLERYSQSLGVSVATVSTQYISNKVASRAHGSTLKDHILKLKKLVSI